MSEGYVDRPTLSGKSAQQIIEALAQELQGDRDRLSATWGAGHVLINARWGLFFAPDGSVDFIPDARGYFVRIMARAALGPDAPPQQAAP